MSCYRNAIANSPILNDVYKVRGYNSPHTDLAIPGICTYGNSGLLQNIGSDIGTAIVTYDTTVHYS